MHGLYHRDDVFHWSLGEDAVAEIKDVAGPPASAFENIFYSPADLLRGGKERGWVQVPLYAGIVSN